MVVVYLYKLYPKFERGIEKRTGLKPFWVRCDSMDIEDFSMPTSMHMTFLRFDSLKMKT